MSTQPNSLNETHSFVRDFMLWWNSTFPLDYWWRQKHNIPFNSSEHRRATFFAIKAEWEEENLITLARNEKNRDLYIEEYKVTGNYLFPSENSVFDKRQLDQMDWDKFLDD